VRVKLQPLLLLPPTLQPQSLLRCCGQASAVSKAADLQVPWGIEELAMAMAVVVAWAS